MLRPCVAATIDFMANTETTALDARVKLIIENPSCRSATTSFVLTLTEPIETAAFLAPSLAEPDNAILLSDRRSDIDILQDMQ